MAGTLMSSFLGVKPWLCMLLLVIPIIAYTYLGGFRAIVTTDLVQFSIMVVFMIALAVTAVVTASASSESSLMQAIQNSAPPWSGQGQVFNPFFLGALFPIVLLVGYLPGWLIEQDLSLRIQAAKTTRDARKGAILALVLITVFILVLPNIAAFCALVKFTTAPCKYRRTNNTWCSARRLGGRPQSRRPECACQHQRQPRLPAQ